MELVNVVSFLVTEQYDEYVNVNVGLRKKKDASSKSNSVLCLLFSKCDQ